MEELYSRFRPREVKVEGCECKRTVNSTLTDEEFLDGEKRRARAKGSMCSAHAAERGEGQRVLGFSFYGDTKSKLGKERQYFEGIRENLELVPKFYPGWVLR